MVAGAASRRTSRCTKRRPELRACEGASCVISTLQGLEEVIVDVQTRLLDVAIEQKVRRFIPSDFSADFTKLADGSHRNFDLRRRFHKAARGLIDRSLSPIEITSIFQGGFTELLGSGWVLFDYKKRLDMLKLAQVAVPEPGPREVRIRVKAAAINPPCLRRKAVS
jgi:hypothetical protein